MCVYLSAFVVYLGGCVCVWSKRSKRERVKSTRLDSAPCVRLCACEGAFVHGLCVCVRVWNFRANLVFFWPQEVKSKMFCGHQLSVWYPSFKLEELGTHTFLAGYNLRCIWFVCGFSRLNWIILSLYSPTRLRRRHLFAYHYHQNQPETSSVSPGANSLVLIRTRFAIFGITFLTNNPSPWSGCLKCDVAFGTAYGLRAFI